MSKISQNIKRQRIQKGLSQEELAQKLFVTRQTVSNYETGKSNPDLDTLIKLSEILETDVETLLYGDTACLEKKIVPAGLRPSGSCCCPVGLRHLCTAACQDHAGDHL